MCAYLLQLAFQRGCITAEERSRVFGVMRQLGLALWHEVCTLDVLMQVLLLAVLCCPAVPILVVAPVCIVLCNDHVHALYFLFVCGNAGDHMIMYDCGVPVLGS